MSTNNRQIIDVTYRNPQGEIVTKRYNGYPIIETSGVLAIMDYGLVSAFAPGVWVSVIAVNTDEIEQELA